MNKRTNRLLTLALGMGLGIGLIACSAATAAPDDTFDVPPITEGHATLPEVEVIVQFGEWMTAEALCGDLTIGEERLVTRVTYDDFEGVSVPTVTEEIEGRVRDLTPEEIEALPCDVVTEDVIVEGDWKTQGNRTAGGVVTMFDGETFNVLVTVNDDGSYHVVKQ